MDVSTFAEPLRADAPSVAMVAPTIVLFSAGWIASNQAHNAMLLDEGTAGRQDRG